jgi:periplasmic protein TonB
VTVVRFRLNRDGSLNGNPEVVRTDGQTAANRPQVARHQEQAIRAVRLAAAQGFNLPERFYSGVERGNFQF